MQSLEGMVRQLSNNNTKYNRSVANDHMNPDDAVRILSHDQIPGTKVTPTPTICDTPSGSEQNTDQAPLIDLFSRTLDVRSDHSTSKYNFSLTSQPLPIDEYISALKALVPRIDDLLLILESTAVYWFIWGTQPPGTDDKRFDASYGIVAMVKNFILASFESRAPLAVAKSTLWLALCVQQLPANVIRRRNDDLPASLQTLFDAYMAGADAILTCLGESNASVERLECLLLFSKCCINMGKPRRAWFSVRSGINCALILGLHRSTRHTTLVQNSLWSQAWQIDRQISSILGVPHSVLHVEPAIGAYQSPIAMIIYRVTEMAGRISLRNQGLQQISMEEIEAEFKDHILMIPEDWWLVMPPEDLSFEALYARQVSKMYFWRLKEISYFPEMLEALQNPHSSQDYRENTVEACRNMISAYEVLRNSSKSALVICDLMDFMVFNAALVIAIHLLASSSTRNTTRDVDDWGIITHLIQTLRQLSRAIECSVAERSATLLEYIYAAHHGTYKGPEEYTAVIPWFGKVKIRSVPRQQETTSLLTPSSEIRDDSLHSIIEFGINRVPSGVDYPSGCGSDPWLNQFNDYELGMDWTPMDNIDWEYDWNQIFFTGNPDTNI
ncbi:hypothetical protein PISL3812_01523 [Talaromyces islandicus]|uniref:Xylanolytic transcriptional activator regulatory domain-containing protein n=1 Tax=Talaromyces islandicus TaxID=28573 RepID=A0A0U1LMK2_TALIS|nr:hypothetical protein PISL3812_01523 [Talaromyces islandicus]